MKSNLNNAPVKKRRGKRTALTSVSLIIGKNIKLLREARRLSQSDVADILGISYQQVQKYESGKNRIPMESLLTLKDYYGVPYDFFIKERPQLDQKPKKRDVELSNFIYERIQTVPSKNMRERIIQVVDVLCS